MNKLVAVIGMCGSGKSEAVKFFVSKGYKKVYFGDVVMRELNKKGLEINETNERNVREELRKKHGMGVMAEMSLPFIDEYLETNNVVIESLYSWEEYKVMRNKYGSGFKLITIYTTKSLRYERLKKRKFRPLDNEESEMRDIHEIEKLDKGGPIAFTDYLITNDGTLEELNYKLSEIEKRL
jgi:dephospho-CoA kinase